MLQRFFGFTKLFVPNTQVAESDSLIATVPDLSGCSKRTLLVLGGIGDSSEALHQQTQVTGSDQSMFDVSDGLCNLNALEHEMNRRIDIPPFVVKCSHAMQQDGF